MTNIALALLGRLVFTPMLVLLLVNVGVLFQVTIAGMVVNELGPAVTALLLTVIALVHVVMSLAGPAILVMSETAGLLPPLLEHPRRTSIRMSLLQWRSIILI